jgi:hypothetical protein
MKIYTANPDNERKYEICRQHGLGIMLSPRYKMSLSPKLREFPVAVDNGAWRAFASGKLWDEYAFLKLVSRVIDDLDMMPDFIILPDIVGGGLRSMFRSLRFVERLEGPVPLALAVQDGLEPNHVAGHAEKFGYIFVGGTEEWKWATAKQWVEFAHAKGLKCHIGRAGTPEKLELARELGADSVDSSSIVRNDTWINLERYKDPHPSLF